MRMGLHLNTNAGGDAVVEYVRRVKPPIMKTLSPSHDIIARCRAVSPGTRWIGREVWDPQTFNSYGDFKNRVLSKAREHKGYVDAWEGYNECGWKGEDLRRFAQCELGLAKRLNDAGFIACIGGFSTGFLEADKDFAYFRAALEYCHEHPSAAWLHFHEYSAPYVQFGWRTPDGRNQMAPGFTGYSANADAYRAPGLDGWLTLRYRTLRQRLVADGLSGVRFVITESGIDGGVTNRPGGQGGGWREFADAEWTAGPCGDYAAQLGLYWAQISRDPYVIGGVDFGWGDISDKWTSFRLDQDAAMLERVTRAMEMLPGAAPVTPPVQEVAMIDGIDVSRWQGEMDWTNARAAGAVFAWCKASEGSDWQDPRYGDNAAGAGRCGVAWGPYHFYRNAIDPVRQADWFARVVLNAASKNRVLPPAIDLEDTKTPVDPAALRVFVEAVAAKLGRPIIYTGAWWMRQQDASALSFLGAYPLWLAHYGTSSPVVPAPWRDWAVWQWASRGTGAAYGAESEFVDRNRFRGSLNDLVALARPGTGATPAPTLDVDGLRAAAQALQEHTGILVNPGAALTREIAVDGRWPVTNEAPWSDASGEYVYQVGQAPTGGRVVYVWSASEGRVIEVEA